MTLTRIAVLDVIPFALRNAIEHRVNHLRFLDGLTNDEVEQIKQRELRAQAVVTDNLAGVHRAIATNPYEVGSFADVISKLPIPYELADGNVELRPWPIEQMANDQCLGSKTK